QELRHAACLRDAPDSVLVAPETVERIRQQVHGEVSDLGEDRGRGGAGSHAGQPLRLARARGIVAQMRLRLLQPVEAPVARAGYPCRPTRNARPYAALR